MEQAEKVRVGSESLPPELSSFKWLESHRRLVVDSLGILFLIVGLAAVLFALTVGKLVKLGTSDLLNAGSVLSAAGGIFLGLGSRKRASRQ
jgi:hypothetical protein